MALAPATAWACEEPPEREERERVAGVAGDTVHLKIPNTLRGAQYVISVDDGGARKNDEDGAREAEDGGGPGEDREREELVSGEDDDAEAGADVEVEVPDLGPDERRVDLVVEVRHGADGADWAYRVQLDYGGRAAAEPPKQPAPERDGSAPAPAPERTADARSAPQPQPQPEAAGDAGAAPHPPVAAPPPPSPPPVPSTPTAPAPPPMAPAGPAPPGFEETSGLSELFEGLAAVETAVPAVVAKASPRRGSRRAARTRRRTRVPEPAALAAPERRRPREPVDRGGVRLPDVDLPGFGSGLAWSVIGGGGLAFALAGLGVGGLARHRRRRRLVLR